MNQANQVPSATTSEVPIPKQGLNKGSLETICSAPLQFQGHSILQPGRLGRSWKLQKNTNLADSVETDASSKPPAIWIILCRLQLNLNACPNSPNTQTMQLKRKDHNCHGDYANSSSLISLYCFWPLGLYMCLSHVQDSLRLACWLNTSLRQGFLVATDRRCRGLRFTCQDRNQLKPRKIDWEQQRQLQLVTPALNIRFITRDAH